MVNQLGYCASEYEKFQTLRRPALDRLLQLIQRVPSPRILDLGCGSGDFTMEIARALSACSVCGVEPSLDMLSSALQKARAGFIFVPGEIDTFETEEKFDLVVCNGVLHYSKNHAHVLRKMRSWLNPHGQVAIQLPANRDTWAISSGLELADSPKFSAHLQSFPKVSGALKIDEYARILHELNFSEQVVRMEAHAHPLPSGEVQFQWLKQTFINGYQSHLPPAVSADFEADYRSLFEREFPFSEPCLYVLKRLYIWAQA